MAIHQRNRQNVVLWLWSRNVQRKVRFLPDWIFHTKHAYEHICRLLAGVSHSTLKAISWMDLHWLTKTILNPEPIRLFLIFFSYKNYFEMAITLIPSYKAMLFSIHHLISKFFYPLNTLFLGIFVRDWKLFSEQINQRFPIEVIFTNRWRANDFDMKKIHHKELDLFTLILKHDLVVWAGHI